MGLTQSEFGELLQVSARTISQWEAAGPPESRRKAIEQAIGTELPDPNRDGSDPHVMTIAWSGWRLDLHSPDGIPKALVERTQLQIMEAATRAWHEAGLDDVPQDDSGSE
jgi:transcriptional regulator with XRE-family HTH domain